MLMKLVQAVVVAVVVTLACILVGAILVTLKVDIAVTVGNFFKQWSGVLGVLAGLWWMVSGASWTAPWRKDGTP